MVEVRHAALAAAVRDAVSRSTMKVARVLIINEQRIVAETLARRLEEEDDIRVVGIATSDAAGRSAAETLGPDIAILEVDQAHEQTASDLISHLVSRDPPIKAIVVVDEDDSRLASRVIRAGADAVMTTDDAVENLITAVLTVAQNHAWVLPRLLGGVLREFRASRPPPNEFDRRLELLTAREHEVLQRMVSGWDHAAIARDLVVSVNTVRTHSQRILSKLEVHSGLEAVSIVRQSRSGQAHSTR
jgi:DNA-binding NarL/FixJ family response regulator